MREIILAIQIEKRYTKKEIFTIYCNQMYLGHGAYGVEAASRLYFNKSNKQLSLEEAALIAGIFQSPERQSPFVDMKRATQRRNVVLQRHGRRTLHHAGAGRRRQAEADRHARRSRTQPPGIAPFFVEEVRKHLERQYGAKVLYENGLASGRRSMRGCRNSPTARSSTACAPTTSATAGGSPTRNVLDESHTIDGFKDDRWIRPIAAGRRRSRGRGHRAEDRRRRGCASAAITRISARPATPGRAGRRRPTCSSRAISSRSAVTKIDEATGAATVTLDQTPIVEGAIVAIENRTGQIKAMVGGWSFSRSKFNRAVQAYRQLGSTFKPIVYTAAIDRGYTPTSILIDAPVSYPSGNGQIYSPHNYDHKFEGPVTLRWALEESRNIPAIKMMDTLGPKNVLDYAKRFGFDEDFPPYLPIALGAGDATLLEITSAYTTFPNQGVRMKPFTVLNVKDRDGNLLEENRAEPSDVIRADTAFVMTNLLQRRAGPRHGNPGGVAWPRSGRWPARPARSTTTPTPGSSASIPTSPSACGSGSTTNGSRSAAAEQGSFAALPMWMEFMKAYIDGRPDKDEPPQFEAPGNIVFLTVDKGDGAVLPSDTPGAIREAFISGTQPGGGGSADSRKRTTSTKARRLVFFVSSRLRGPASTAFLSRRHRTRAILPTPLSREPEIAFLVDLHVAHGAAAARDRPRQELLRLGVESDEHVLRLVAGLDVPDGAV